ncbi:MAG: type II toxin-antitoxin system RelE/ParE family toxin [Pseudomonadota bacterium]
MKKIFTTPQFDKWFDGLKDQKAKLAIDKRFKKLEIDQYGDYKHVGDGVFELRFHLSSGYRIYFIERGKEILVILAGGNKSGQTRDIKKAIELSKLV